MFSALFVPLICMKFSEKVGDGPINRRLNFGGDPVHRLDYRAVFRIRHYWEIRKVINGPKSATHTDSPDGGTGKTRLGGGMYCPSASSFGNFSGSLDEGVAAIRPT